MKITEDSLHLMTIAEISKIEKTCRDYLRKWYGFNRQERSLDFIEKARWRLKGRSIMCCECHSEYPYEDLHFRNQICCEKCR